jgi:hypothetical protein
LQAIARKSLQKNHVTCYDTHLLFQ